MDEAVARDSIHTSQISHLKSAPVSGTFESGTFATLKLNHLRTSSRDWSELLRSHRGKGKEAILFSPMQDGQKGN